MVIALAALGATNGAKAQVTIGSMKTPEAFSILELISDGNRGLRLPQLSDAEKVAAFGADNAVLITAGQSAKGLQIFNTTTLCVETWNGISWISNCDMCGDAPCRKLSAPLASNQTLCTSAKISDLVAVGEEGATLNWYSAEMGGSPLESTRALTNGATYYVSQDNGVDYESERTPVKVTLSGLPVALTLTLSATDEHLRSQKANAGDTNCTDLTTTITATVNDPNATLVWSIAKKHNLATMADINDVAFLSGTTEAVAANTTKSIQLTAKDLEYFNKNTGAYTITVTATACGSCYTSAKTVTKDISVGCGARDITENTWLKFMCHNLGADQTLDPFVYYSKGDTVGYDIKGDLYQWGRFTDGHEKRSNEEHIEVFATSGRPSAAQYNAAVTAYKDIGTEIPYKKFIYYLNSTYYDWVNNTDITADESKSRWGVCSGGSVSNTMHDPKANNDPCPDGWKVPSMAQWGSTVKEGSSAMDCSSSATTANTWSQKDYGYYVGASLFLPFAGYRTDSHDSSCDEDRHLGCYWSSTWKGTANAYSLYFYYIFGNIAVGMAHDRAKGNSVRCVSE